jgi:CheY-like chemotaxis protein
MAATRLQRSELVRSAKPFCPVKTGVSGTSNENVPWHVGCTLGRLMLESGAFPGAACSGGFAITRTARILSVQPDSAQSAALRHALRRADAEILVVDSIDDALTVIDSQLPDLVLLDTFLPPHETDNLAAYLRILSDASHVHLIHVPLIQPAPDGTESFQNRRGRRWFSRFRLNESQRSGTQPVACNAQMFAVDLATYVSRSHIMRAAAEHWKARHEPPGILECRDAQRWLPAEVSVASAVRLATTSADLLNLSSGGALVRSHVRPDPRFRSRSVLTFYSRSGEEVHQTGRLIRCHVTSMGNRRFLYDVAFRFDESFALCLPTSQPDLLSAAGDESPSPTRPYRALLSAPPRDETIAESSALTAGGRHHKSRDGVPVGNQW